MSNKALCTECQNHRRQAIADPCDRRDNPVMFKLTNDEKSELEAEAAALGLCLSHYIQRIVGERLPCGLEVDVLIEMDDEECYDVG